MKAIERHFQVLLFINLTQGFFTAKRTAFKHERMRLLKQWNWNTVEVKYMIDRSENCAISQQNMDGTLPGNYHRELKELRHDIFRHF